MKGEVDGELCFTALLVQNTLLKWSALADDPSEQMKMVGNEGLVSQCCVKYIVYKAFRTRKIGHGHRGGYPSTRSVTQRRQYSTPRGIY